MPEVGKKEEPAKAPSSCQDDSSPKRRSDSPMPGKHGPRWKGTPPILCKPVGDKKELELEKAKIKEEEEEEDDEESSELEKAKNKKKKKKKKQEA